MYPRHVGDEMNEWIYEISIKRGVQYGSRYLIPGLAKLGGGGGVCPTIFWSIYFVINSTTSIVVYGIKFKPNYIIVIVCILYL